MHPDATGDQGPSKPERQGPEEAPGSGPQEQPKPLPLEEAPEMKPAQVCGINGCTTWYDDPAVMKKHYERQHGVGGPPNLNKPAPRNTEVKLA